MLSAPDMCNGSVATHPKNEKMEKENPIRIARIVLNGYYNLLFYPFWDLLHSTSLWLGIRRVTVIVTRTKKSTAIGTIIQPN